ncbi:MAG TPA: glycosyltransferase [Stellaceae bacterium]|nr:glycosyltransferase [Stellaceae bacterium]
MADPDPPLDGLFVYSGGLIRALAGAGAETVVLGLQRPESIKADNAHEQGVVWRLAPHEPLTHWASVTSCLPHLANRCRTPAMRELLQTLLREDHWDAVVFDSISAGWALRAVLERYPRDTRRPLLVYISHNHEESLRASLVPNRQGVLKRQAQRLDAVKVTRLERALVRAADLVTAITPEDRELYRRRWPDKRIEVLMPGYSGRMVTERRITSALPRRAVLVGSFDWIAKRLNLEEFVRVADPIFAAQGIELQVIGSGGKTFLAELGRTLSATRFIGTVDRVEPYVKDARLAIVPERHGGGFKLKVLDYIFNRIPIFALNGSVAGVPLRHDESILLFPDQRSLALGILQAIDDVARLDDLQNAAFHACQGAFDWRSRGDQLMSAMASI